MKENPSTKEIYFWNIIGSFLNALSSVILLMLVNRALDIKNSDIFALTFSAAQLMATIGLFKLRVFQATDIREKYNFTDYFIFRLCTCAAMLIASFIYGFFYNYDSYKFVILILLCLYKLGDCFSDVFQGLFQQKERLDLAGKSCAIKVVIPTICFALFLIFTKNLFFAVLSLTVSEFLLLLLYDLKLYSYFCKKYHNLKVNVNLISKKKVLAIFVKCMPLFINSYLITDIFNIPKNMIDIYIERGIFTSGTQTYYNVLFMPAFVMSLFTVVFRPQLTTMAMCKNKREFKKLKMIIIKIIILLLLCLSGCMIGGYMIGIPILSIVYGTGNALYQYKDVLICVILGGGFNAIAYIFDDTITIFRMQKYVLFSYVISWLFCKITIGFFLNSFGLNGAALNYMFSMFILMVVNIVIFIFCYKREEKIDV